MDTATDISNTRLHLNDFHPQNPLTQGYYCGHCGFRLRYSFASKAYVCDCEHFSANKGMIYLTK